MHLSTGVCARWSCWCFYLRLIVMNVSRIVYNVCIFSCFLSAQRTVAESKKHRHQIENLQLQWAILYLFSISLVFFVVAQIPKMNGLNFNFVQELRSMFWWCARKIYWNSLAVFFCVCVVCFTLFYLFPKSDGRQTFIVVECLIASTRTIQYMMQSLYNSLF